MKRADFITNIALVPIDFALIFAAAISAYFLRFSETVSELRPVFYEMPFTDYLNLVLKVAIFAILVFAVTGFYAMKSKKLSRELPRIVTGVSTVVIFLILAIFWKRELFSSRFIIIFSWALAIGYLFIARIIVFGIRNFFFKKGFGQAKVVVLGDSKTRQPIIDIYKNKPQLGFKVVGEFANLTEFELSDLNKKKIDDLLQSDSSISKSDALDLLTYCQENQIHLKYVASLFQAQNQNADLQSLAGLPIIEIQETTLDGWRRVIKTIFDFVVALIMLIVLIPFFVIIAIIIKATSRGPVFVGLQRVGRKSRIFTMYKFRSMVQDAHKMKSDMEVYNERVDGPLFKMKNDPRVTKFGRWLRKTSIDELPQLFNVMMGQMSLVGPRPHEPEEVDKYKRGYKKLLTIKPGITGMAQVSGRSNLDFAEEAKLDIFYIENWSVFLDLIILLKTPKAVLSGDHDK